MVGMIRPTCVKSSIIPKVTTPDGAAEQMFGIRMHLLVNRIGAVRARPDLGWSIDQIDVH